MLNPTQSRAVEGLSQGKIILFPWHLCNIIFTILLALPFHIVLPNSELLACVFPAWWCSLSLPIKLIWCFWSVVLARSLSLRCVKPYGPLWSDSWKWRLKVVQQPWKTAELRKLRSLMSSASFKDVSEMKLEEEWSNKTLPVSHQWGHGRWSSQSTQGHLQVQFVADFIWTPGDGCWRPSFVTTLHKGFRLFTSLFFFLNKISHFLWFKKIPVRRFLCKKRLFLFTWASCLSSVHLSKGQPYI